MAGLLSIIQEAATVQETMKEMICKCVIVSTLYNQKPKTGCMGNYIFIFANGLEVSARYLGTAGIPYAKVLVILKDRRRCSHEKPFLNESRLSLLIFAVSDNQNSNCLGHQI